jgi:glucose/arabinose dehydrogenase
MMWRLMLALVALLAFVIAPGALAQPIAQVPTNATVVAGGLINPRGFTFAPDGALIVAEPGFAPPGFVPHMGQPTPLFQPGTSTTGRISRVDLTTGARSTVADGLPSSAYGPTGDTLGPSSVAYLGSDLYAAIAAGPVHGWSFFPSGVYKVNPDGTVTLVANLDVFNSKNPVSFIAPDDEISNPYDMIAAGGALWVTDGNRQQIYRVTPDGTITRFIDLSGDHPVTTGLARAQDGSLITVELTPVPFPEGGGRVLRIGMDGQSTTLATGTTAATGVAIAPDGTIYIVEISTSLGRPPFFSPGTGRVARMDGDGTLTTIVGGLTFPTMARIGPDGALYVSNFSVEGDGGQGEIVRIQTRR